MKDLLEAGCHFGHKSARWHPKMKKYIYTNKSGVHIFDLAKTKEALEKAAAFVKAIVAKGGRIIFVGTKRTAQKTIKEAAQETKMPYVINHWLGGTLTNWMTIKRNNIDKLSQLKDDEKEGKWAKYTKKERLLLRRQVARLERLVGGLADLGEFPEALFVVDARQESLAVKEAKEKGIRVIAMVDTDSNPEGIDFVIPTNDDATGAIEYVVGVIVGAVEEGRKSKKRKS